MLSHIAPRGIGLRGGESPGHIGSAVVAEHAQKPRDANHATRHMALVFLHDVLHEVADYACATVIGHKAECQRQQIGRRRIVAIESAFPLCSHAREEPLIKCRGHRLCLLLELVSLSGESLCAGEVAQQMQHANDIGRGEQRTIGLACRVFAMDEFEPLGWHTPVAVGVLRDDAIGIAICLHQMSNPFLDVRIAIGKRFCIAVLPPEHIAGERQGGGPRDVIAEVVPEQRSHIGQTAIGALSLADVAHPLRIESLVGEQIALAQRTHGPIA